MAGRNPLNKTKVIQLDTLTEVVEYKESLENLVMKLKRRDNTRALIVEGEIAGINRVLDILRLRTDVIMVTKLREEGKLK